MSDTKDKDQDLSTATVGILDAWTKRYRHTVVGRVLSFLGFGK